MSKRAGSRLTLRVLNMPHCNRARSLTASLQERNEVRFLSVLLQPCEDHLRAGNVLLRIDKEVPHVLATPYDPGVFDRAAEAVVLRASRAAHDVPQRGAALVRPALLERVALRALCLEELRPFLVVAARDHGTLRNLDGHLE